MAFSYARQNLLAGVSLFFLSLLARGESRSSLQDSPSLLSLARDQIEDRLVQDLASPDQVKSRLGVSLLENMTESQGSISLRRHLASGDFESFNELFQSATIRLPDATLNDRIIGISLTLKLTNLRCTNVQVGDIVITYNKDSVRRLSYQVEVVDLDLDCFLDYRYDYGFLGGNGNCKASTDNNDASLALAFSSLSFEEFPPNDVAMESCTADINVSKLDFSGDWLSSILDVMERLIRGTVEGEVQDVACTELSSLADDLLQDLLDMVFEFLDPYLEPLTISQIDPLAAEKALVIPNGTVLVDYQTTEETLGKWFKTILDEADDFLGTSVDDVEGPTSTGRDLGVNVFLRENFLDDDRAFTVEVVDLPFDFDGVLYEGHDKLTQTTIRVERIKLFGLDTFTRFAPLSDIGKYTLQNELSWDYLTIELDLDIVIKPSTLPDSLLDGPGDVMIEEKISVDFGVDNVDSIVSVLLAVDQDALGSLQLGPLLDLDSLASCLMSVIFDLSISGLDVTIGSIREPVLDGFISPGIDRVVSRTVRAFFVMYEAVVLKTIPSLFWTTIPDILNDNLDMGDSECPELRNFGDELIDFRDLFLEPDVAAAAGGSGDEPYGSLASTLFTLLQDQFTAIGDDGLPQINSLVLRPFMESQSGEETLLSFPGKVFSFVREDISSALGSSLGDSFQLALSNTRIRNLDTIATPLSILQPSTGPHVLKNLVNIGPVSGRPLNGVMSLLVALDGDDSPLDMRNELDISASVDASVFVADILARIGAEPLLKFPLRDVLNFDCWLSVFQTPDLDADGLRIDPDAESGLSLTEFLLTMTTLSLDVTCVSCTSPGAVALPDLLSILDDEGSFRILRSRIESFAAEILLSDQLVQTQLDRLLSEASKSCPHRSEYDENAILADFVPLQLPALSKEAIETVVYSATLAAEIGLVVFAESHTSYNSSSTDYLSGQKALEVPEGTRLLNLLSLGETVGSWFDTAIEEVNAYLSGFMEDVGGPNGDEDLGINVVARNIFLDDSRTLSITFDGASFTAGESGEMRIELESLKIFGLDTFTSFNALDLVANQTIRNLVGWKELDIEVDLFIQTSDDAGMLTISMGADKVDAAVSLLLAIDLDLAGALELGSLLWLDQILPCFLSSAVGVELTELSLNVDAIRGPSFDGFLSDYMASAVRNVTRAIFDENGYRTRLVDALPGIFDVTIRSVLNNWLDHYLSQESSVSCPKFAMERKLDEDLSFVDFRDIFVESAASLDLGGSGDGQYGDLFRSLRGVLTNQILKVDPASGKSAINDFLVSPLTERQSGKAGTLLYEGDLFDTGTYIDVGGLQAEVRLGIYDARIENLDTIGNPLSLLDPVLMKPHELNNTAGFGVGSDSLRFAARVLLAIDGKGDMQIRNEVDVSVDLTSVNAILGFLLKVAETPFVSFPMRDFTNLNCWLATIPAPELDSRGVRATGEAISAALSQLALSIADVHLNVTCISCSGPDMHELSELLSSPKTSEDLNRAFNNVLGIGTEFLNGDFLQIQVDRFLAEAPKQCPHHEAYNENYVAPAYEPFQTESGGDDSLQFLLTLLMIGTCIIFSVMLVTFLVRFLVRRRHAMWLRSLPGHSVFILQREQTFQAEKEAELNRMTKSMFLSEAIPCYVRWLIPIVVIGNIALFLSGHLSLGATVNIHAELAGQSFTVDKFFEFSMAKSVFDIWEAGGKALAILLIIFSGVWPYTKQFVTLGLWFLPPTWVSASRRGSIFLWLDALAKWSMVDIFTLVVTIAAFQVTIESPDVSFLPENFYSVSLLVVPLWGLYANMTAQLVSQVSSHYVIHYHRRIIAAAQDELEMTCATTEAIEDREANCSVVVSESQSPDSESESLSERLCDHSFTRPHRGESDKLRTRRMVNPLLLGGAISMTILTVIGCILPTFSVDVLGILGVAVESGQDFKQAKTDFTIFSIAQVLMDEAKFLGGIGDYIGLGTLSILLISTVLIVPLLQSLMLLRQWFRPMNDKIHRRNQVVIEILAAWQYVEVYLLSAIVAAWQLGPISEFMLNEYCDSLSNTFASLVFYGVLDPADAQCFRVQAKVEDGSFVLIGGAVLLALINTFVNKAFFQFMRDKSEATILQDSAKLSVGADIWDSQNVDEAISLVHPAPVLFTDTFRWFLMREDVRLSQRTLGLSLGSLTSRGRVQTRIDEESTLGVGSGFPESPTVSFAADVGRHSPSQRSVYVESDMSDSENIVRVLGVNADSPDIEDISCSESVMDIESDAGNIAEETSSRLAIGVAMGILIESSPEKDIVFQPSEDGSEDSVDGMIS